MNSKFVSYLRVSTERQGRSGLGIEAQRKAVEDYLNGDQGELLEEYVEVESGKKDERPTLKRALEHCDLTGATLLIAKLDRLSRDAYFLLGLQRSGVSFVCADMPEANELTVGIMALIAQEERKRISERTKAALAAAKARGTKLGNPNGAEHLRGLGNKQAVKRIKENADQRAERLRGHIKKLLEQGIDSANGIAAELNRSSIKTPRGGQWYAASVQRLMKRLEMV